MEQVCQHSRCGRQKYSHRFAYNRVAKEAIKGLGANKTHKTICRVGKALATISPVLDNFDKECGVADVSGLLTKPTIEKDVIIVVQLLQQSEVFRHKTDKKHEAFPRVHTILHIKGKKCLEDWMLQRLTNLK